MASYFDTSKQGVLSTLQLKPGSTRQRVPQLLKVPPRVFLTWPTLPCLQVVTRQMCLKWGGGRSGDVKPTVWLDDGRHRGGLSQWLALVPVSSNGE